MNNHKRIWDVGDIAFISGFQAVEIIDQDVGQMVLKIRYLQSRNRRGKEKRKIGEIRKVSRRNLYPRQRSHIIQYRKDVFHECLCCNAQVNEKWDNCPSCGADNR